MGALMLLGAEIPTRVGDALSFAFGMFWEILWALILGFALSAVVQAVVSKREMRRLLPHDSPRSIGRATALGVVSSSCSYFFVLPILDIYRKYYGWRMAGFLLATFYATMVAARLIVEFVFQGLGLERTKRDAKVEMASVRWNYTTVLNILFLALAALLVWPFVRTGGSRCCGR